LARIVIDAKEAIVGRLGTLVAKLARMGNEVILVNCEEAVISGGRRAVIAENVKTVHRGSTEWGPHPQSRPDRFVRRMFRNMMNYKSPGGKKDYERVRTFIGVPEEYAKEINKDYKFKKSSDLVKNKYVKVSDICKQIGGKW
jgi:large subunit ribosomal protein L13